MFLLGLASTMFFFCTDYSQHVFEGEVCFSASLCECRLPFWAKPASPWQENKVPADLFVSTFFYRKNTRQVYHIWFILRKTIDGTKENNLTQDDIKKIKLHRVLWSFSSFDRSLTRKIHWKDSKGVNEQYTEKIARKRDMQTLLSRIWRPQKSLATYSEM